MICAPQFRDLAEKQADDIKRILRDIQYTQIRNSPLTMLYPVPRQNGFPLSDYTLAFSLFSYIAP